MKRDRQDRPCASKGVRAHRLSPSIGIGRIPRPSDVRERQLKLHPVSPAVASSRSARSSTFLAMGPCSECRESNGAALGSCGTRAGDGRKPTTPQKAAGMRREPPRSVPVASQQLHAASDAAEPPLEPPAVFVSSCGVAVVSNRALNDCAPAPNSGVLDLANGIPPWPSRTSIIGWLCSAMADRCSGEP